MSEVTAVPLRPVGKAGVTALWAGVAILIVAGTGAAVYSSRAPAMMAMPPAQYLAANAKRHGVTTMPSGLEYQVIKPGAGPTPTVEDVVLVDYKGTLTSGKEFDASPKGQPVSMPVGQVVPGFAEALMLMPKGSTYRVWLPPQLAYGDKEAGPIPANSVLVFDITMHEFQQMQAAAGMPPGVPPTQ